MDRAWRDRPWRLIPLRSRESSLAWVRTKANAEALREERDEALRRLGEEEEGGGEAEGGRGGERKKQKSWCLYSPPTRAHTHCGIRVRKRAL